MSYTALYRKYRPSNFCDVQGQEHIVTTLQNQIKTGRLGHAYLMCGTRGTGKTTIARIFAKAVNCEGSIEGNPCEKCKSCLSINEGSSLNVIEIDAASNNGVDNIRRIREEVAYGPTEGKYKVYIIDEVHMLSARGAFPALLKTLEEPPSYVIFILATTEKHGIPVTILSRCQQYDLKRMRMDTIANWIEQLLENEGVISSKEALLYIAKLAEGSMRDALSLLDQCIAFHIGEELTYDKVLKVLGAVEVEVFSKLLKGILQQDVARVMKLIEDIIMDGAELSQFVSGFTWYLRNLLLLKTSDNIKSGSTTLQIEDTLDITSENISILKEEAKLIELETLLRFIRITSKLSEQLRFTTQKRIAVEVAFIKLCIPSMETSVDSLIDRIRILEEKVAAGVIGTQSHREERVKLEVISNESNREERAEEANRGYKNKQLLDDKDEEAQLSDQGSKKIKDIDVNKKKDTDRQRTENEDSQDDNVVKNITEELPKMIASISPLLKAYFVDSKEYRVALWEDILTITHCNENACNIMTSQEKLEKLEQLVEGQIGRKIEVRVVHKEEKREDKAKGIEQIIQENIKFPITEI
jgi:DNA polymerase-3 subunit gamma/tau